MPLLNFEKSAKAKPVAVVRGGDDDGKVLYLHTEEKNTKGSGKKDIDPDAYLRDLRHLKASDKKRAVSKMVSAIEHPSEGAVPFTDAETVKVFDKMKKDLDSDTSIVLPTDSMFQPIPDPDPSVRQIWYAAGISGSGKSYFARNIAENYKKLFPDREIYLVSKYPVDEDDTLGKMKIGKPKSISLDSIVEDYPSIEEFKNCLIIFDDYDTLQAPYDKVVQKLIDDLAIRGRHTATSMCVLSHYLTNYKKTRLILGEAHFIVLYPMATSFKAMKYVCEHHCGMTKDEIYALKKLGRWCCIHKVFPQYLIAAHTARLLNT